MPQLFLFVVVVVVVVDAAVGIVPLGGIWGAKSTRTTCSGGTRSKAG